MILYHGSDCEIKQPDISHSRVTVDFGRGFYTTPLLEQAAQWCAKFKRQGKNGIVSRYSLDESAFENEKVLRFETYSEDWLDFVLACRRGLDESGFNIVIGGVANDKVFNTIELYFDGLIDKSETLKRLRYEKPNLQVCLRSQDIIDKYLTFNGSEKL